MLWCYFLDVSQHDSERYMEEKMTVTEGNIYYNEQRYIKRDPPPPPPESTHQKFIVVLVEYTVLIITMWGEHRDYYKLL